MKLRNIIAIGLSLAALVSCSKDSQPINVKDLKDAKVNISLKPSLSGSNLKAGGDDYALDGETNINSVTVLSFSADGSQILVDPYWTDGMSTADDVTTILSVPTKATNALIAVLANVSENAFSGVTTYAAFQDRLAQLADQSQNNLAMSAQVIAASTELAEGDNYIGYTSQTNINNINTPLELTRLAARIELIGATTNFASNAALNGRTVRINSIYLANQKTASRFASTAYWGAVMADGNLADGSPVTVEQNLPITTVPFRQYVMENTDENNPTQIVINATILASNGYQAETKAFAAIINENGTVLPGRGEAHKYVKRNYIYRLNISFGPNSFTGIRDEDPTPPTPPTPPGPTTGDLNVKVEVVGWGPVSQVVIIK